MTWTNITNAQLAIGAPLRSIDILALRDNITAQANGDAGAPQQQTAGIADNAVTAAKVNKGNGLGTSGTQLVVACPTYNTIGSYVMAGNKSDSTGTLVAGSNYAAGVGANQLAAISLVYEGPDIVMFRTNNLAGTWKWMAANSSDVNATHTGLACRVS